MAVKRGTRQNITVSLPADLVRSVKALVSRRGTSISELVRQSLEELLANDDSHGRALDLILSGARANKRRQAAKWRRSDLYR
ncbi:MAG: ribbon-helix-helix protein, CopG family [Acidobacteria bacterium]|nr:ribbon-helix-helix protein, CopG family [Acidobacteriota bacterium]